MEKEWHLPECADTEALLPIIDCICEPLRRCEQRMIEDRSDSMWKAGYHEALADACAVVGLLGKEDIGGRALLAGEVVGGIQKLGEWFK